MKLRQIVSGCYEAFPLEYAMAALRELTLLDRYQASKGIEAAARLVARNAERAGLRGVEILNFPADGERAWWTFSAPLSWTPLVGSLKLLAETGDEIIADYPAQPCTLATYSNSTPRQGWVAPLVELREELADAELKGAIAVLTGETRSLFEAIQHLETAGALGFVTDVASRPSSPGFDEQVGRIELPQQTTLFGFSIRPSAMSRVLAAARHHGTAHAVIAVERSAGMPVVVGHLPGTTEEEIWLVAHLCHPGPGANDNASGIAALLGIAGAFRQLEDRPGTRARKVGIRFLWGPEFVGTAAYLHEYVRRDAARLPLCVFNLDMVGEEIRQCGGMMLIERSPDHVPSFINALTERCAELLSSHLGAPGAETSTLWPWRVVPFAGMSDHALFADRLLARPAVQLRHYPDRFNHSSADSLDKVSPEELRRCAALAGAGAYFLAHADADSISELEAIVTDWGRKEIETAARSSVSDTRSMLEERDHFVNYVAEHAINSVASIALLPNAGDDGERLKLCAQLQMMAGEQSSRFLSAQTEREPAHPASDLILKRRWDGPFNLRGLLEEASAQETSWFQAAMQQDKSMYSVALALALAIDDASDRHAVFRRTAYAMRRGLDLDFAGRFIDLLLRSGWISYECK